MNSMLRKTLLAASVAATFGVNAAVITPVDTDGATMGVQLETISAEGFAIVGSIDVGLAAGDVTVQITPEAPNYFREDSLILNVTGATIDTSVPLSGIQLVDAAGTTAFAQAIVVEEDQIVFSLVSTDPNPANPFTNVLTTAAAGVDLFLTGVTFDEVSGPVAVSYFVERGTRDIDPASATSVVTIGSQFAASVETALNGVVDVNNQRQTFAAFGTTTSSDSFELTLTSAADLLPVVPSDATIVVEGEDLTFLVDEDGDLLAGQVSVAVNNTATASTDTLTDDGLVSIAIGSDVTGTTMVTLANATGDDAPALVAPQSFTADFAVDYELASNAASTGSIAFNDLNVGAWSLNGASLNVPYLPYGNGLSQVITVSNESDVDGAIEMTVLSDTGEVMGPVMLDVVAAAQSVTSIGGAVSQALSDAGITGRRVNLDITFTITAPSSAVSMFVNYNVRGDRIPVPVTAAN